MRIGFRSAAVIPRAALPAILAALVSACPAAAQTPSINELVSAVVRINTHIAPEGRTVKAWAANAKDQASLSTATASF